MKKKITNLCWVVIFMMISSISHGAIKLASDSTSTTCFANFYSTTANGTVSFNDTSVVSDSVLYHYWTFGDGYNSWATNPTHTYAAGIYSATVCQYVKTTTDSCSICKQVMVRQPDSCKADFTYAPVSGYPATYTFTDESTGNAQVSWRQWSLPDSISRTDSTFTITFDSTLTQANVCLTIRTTSGCQASVCKTIHLNDTVPATTCQASFDAFVQDTLVFFTDSSKTSGTITSWHWNFGDGTSSALQHPSHTYSSTIYKTTACLTITTHTGCQSSICKTVVLKDSVPAFCLANFTYHVDNKTVYFTDTSSVDTTISYRVWQFGDGTYSNDKNPVHTYAQNILTANVCLTVKTAADSCTVCKTITLGTDTCQAYFSYFPLADSTTYQFLDGSYSSSTIKSRSWTISDSTFSMDSILVHTFNPNLSSATVCLTIESVSGCQSTFCQTIILKDTVPVVTCKAAFSYALQQDSINTTGYQYHFYNHSSGSDSLNYVWNFGDDTYSTLKNPVHTYNLPGGSEVSVLLVISSPSGCSDSLLSTIWLPVDSSKYQLSGVVKGTNELLTNGVLLLYKKETAGYMFKNAKFINTGSFTFEQLDKGTYFLYAIPLSVYKEKYLPTYYVNKLRWEDADTINLVSNTYGLTLQLLPVKMNSMGIGKIQGKLTSSQKGFATEQAALETSAPQVGPSAILYTQSGTALRASLTDDEGNFEFDGLAFGQYTLNIEYPNLKSSSVSITLNNETPEATNLVFAVSDNATSVTSFTKDAGMVVSYILHNQLSVRVSEGGNYRVSFTNMSGTVVSDTEMNLEANTDNVLDIANFPKGIYLLKLQNNSATMVKKILR